MFVFKHNLFTHSHLNKLSSSSFASLYKCFRLWCDMISVVSSAKDNIDALDVEFGISFMYNKNKRGPKIEP